MNDDEAAAIGRTMSGENPYAPPAGSVELASPAAVVTMPPAKPRVWTVFVAILAMAFAILAAQIVGAIGVVIWYFAQGGTSNRLAADLLDFIVQPGPFLFLGSLGQIALGGVAIAAAWLSPVPLRERLGLVRPSWSAATSALAIVGSIVPFAIGIAAAYALAEVLPPDPAVAKMYAAMTPAWVLPFLLFISFAPGFFEEMMFRGYVQRRLLERWPAWIAILLTSLVFAIVHVAPHAVVFAFPIGIWLGMMAARSGSTWPGIVCHAAINGLWNVWQLGVRFEIFPEDPPTLLLVGLSVLGLCAFGAALWAMFRSAKAIVPHDAPISGASL
jgi:membrane protease YdiL (CAAX protease family)